MGFSCMNSVSFAFVKQLTVIVVLLLNLSLCKCWPFGDDGLMINNEGHVLLAFKQAIYRDPYHALSNWNPYDDNPCMWRGITCMNGNVISLDLADLSLEGVLVPELAQLSQLKNLVLCRNKLTGTIPKEYGFMQKLEILNLAHNNLIGQIPLNIGNISSLQILILSHNNLEGNIPSELGKLASLSELRLEQNQFYGILPCIDSGIWRIHRSTNLCDLKQLRKADFSFNFLEGHFPSCLSYLPRSSFQGNCFQGQTLHHHMQTICDKARLPSQKDQNRALLGGRRLAHVRSKHPKGKQAPSSNKGSDSAVPAPSPAKYTSHELSRVPVPSPYNHPPAPAPATMPYKPYSKSARSPSAPATERPSHSPLSHSSKKAYSSVPVSEKNESKSSGEHVHAIIGTLGAFIVACLVILLLICHRRNIAAISPWKTGLSGQLQKALIEGAPKLNRTEVEAACEEFSNVIDSSLDGMSYKGTLSNGVEIAVTSTTITTLEHWTDHGELLFRKKIEMLSGLNHKNFANLLGYCIEDVPFTRMMVFEYAPNGTLHEHLHVREAEHLDWSARMRIIMGISYCLQYMHHEKEPPVCLANINSNAVFLTDDFAAKLSDTDIWKEIARETERKKYFGKIDSPLTSEDEKLTGDRLHVQDNIYSLGVLMIEIISGKLPNTNECDSYVSWALGYLHDKEGMKYIVDPSLSSFKDNELERVCEVVKACVAEDPLERPSMKDVVSKLKEALLISPEAACPKLSPLWWAELEIQSHDGS